MSWFVRLFPFLFVDVDHGPSSSLAVPSSLQPEQIDALPLEMKMQLARNKTTPVPVLARLVRERDTDIRVLLARRLGALARKMERHDAVTVEILLEAIRQLTEESLTPVRIALASALKDVAHCPPDVARRLADDVERAVAEPIIRYSLGLSDQDLLALIARYPHAWQTVTIARRNRLRAPVSDAVIETGNTQAGIALLENDSAVIAPTTMDKIRGQPAYEQALHDRNALGRKLRRDLVIVAQNRLHDFLVRQTGFDRRTTARLMETVQRRVSLQDNEAAPAPAHMDETALRDALAIGRDELVIKALAARTGTDNDTVRRMVLDSGAAKPVIALCVRAGLSMGFSVLLQQRMTRLPPQKILYPRDGHEVPLTPEEIAWQLDFFGLDNPSSA